ncbi:MAG: cell division protein FtsQ/DivIB, partial [Hyphomicrobiales bacterium]|nr:cell division protein FtsQ/DivIB [Hyphomicrobiales bacterium]
VYGAPRDIAARAFGFGVDAITISGPVQLKVEDVLKAAAIPATASLPFLDAAAARDRIAAIPMVREATVRKLYPDRLLVTLVERAPAGVWQDAGKLRVVSADGTPFERFDDMRLAGLPYVVGPGAAAHLAEYEAIRAAAGELKPRIRAGVYVGDRRWNLAMTDGTSVLLPEDDPQAAMKRLLALQRDGQILDKDVTAIDLREGDRAFVRLSPAAAAEREKALASKKKTKGG